MKPIKLTEASRKNILENFQKLLADYTGDSDLTVKIKTETLLDCNKTIIKPIVYISAEAYLHMLLLIQQSDNELAWHGTVTRRGDDYFIDKIYVYPQTVTGVTVDADEEAYAKWLMELDDDVINSLRFQGHSHVNMPTSPSGRDTTNWQHFLNLLKPGEFYLFCIGNKKGDFYWNIYDTDKNIIFEDKDIVSVIIDTDGKSFAETVKEETETYIKTNKPVVFNTTNPNTNPCVNQTNFLQHVRKCTTPSKDSKYLDAVPKELQAYGVDYEPEMDIYYVDAYVPGFTYSTTWGCWICDGSLVRERFSKKTKKTNNKTTKKAGVKNESK